MPENIRNKLGKALITVAIFITLCCMIQGFFKNLGQERGGEKDLMQIFCDIAGRQMERTFFLLPAYLGAENERAESASSLFDKVLKKEIPLYGYLTEQVKEKETEDKILAQIIKKQEGTDEDSKNIEESRLDYDDDALHIESGMLKEMQRENSRYLEEERSESTQQEPEQEDGENEPSKPALFVTPKYPVYSYDWSEGWDYEELVSNFYAVDNTTSLKKEYMNLDDLLYRDLSVDKSADGPQILIYHTHSQEGFSDSVPGDPSTTIVGAGEKIADILTEKYGFKVLHHTGEYDVENRDYAYNNSLPALEKILAENPTIEVVIDLHRDEMKEDKKLVIDLQGRPTARFMFFNGMSYIRDKGDISYLENPYIKDNLAFSFQAQVAANEYYPGIARKIYLKAYRYNMHLKPKSLLIELGAQTNTVEEVMNACDPIAHIISIVLGG